MGLREQYLRAMEKLDDEQYQLDLDRELVEAVKAPLDHPDDPSSEKEQKIVRKFFNPLHALNERQKSINRRRDKIKEAQTKLANRGSSWRISRDMKKAAVDGLEAELLSFQELRQQAMDGIRISNSARSMENIKQLTPLIDRKTKQLRAAQVLLQKHLDNKPPNIYARLPEELAVLEHGSGRIIVTQDSGPNALQDVRELALKLIAKPELRKEYAHVDLDTDVSSFLTQKSDSRMPEIQFGASDEDDVFTPFDISTDTKEEETPNDPE